jgi:hypothetical protein
MSSKVGNMILQRSKGEDIPFGIKSSKKHITPLLVVLLTNPKTQKKEK